jgi:hypothetical protein
VPSKITQRIDAYADEAEVELLRLDPSDVYDDAIVGVVDVNNCGHIVYDQAKVIAQTMQQEGWNYEDACEWHDHNTFGQPLAAGMPVFLVWRA